MRKVRETALAPLFLHGIEEHRGFGTVILTGERILVEALQLAQPVFRWKDIPIEELDLIFHVEIIVFRESVNVSSIDVRATLLLIIIKEVFIIGITFII